MDNLYSAKKRNHKYGELIEMVEAENMPLPSWLWLHDEAVLTAAQRLVLTDFFKSKHVAEAKPTH